MAGPLSRAGRSGSSRTVTPHSARLKTVRVASLMDLASSSKRLAPDRSSEPLRSAGLYRANTARPTCLSWELFSRVPRLRQPSIASTPGAGVAACSFGRPLPRGRHVPLSWFCTTSAVYSALEARVYCNPMPDEVRRVSRLPSSARPEPPERGACRAKVRGPLPATLFTPFEDTHAEPAKTGFPFCAVGRELRLSSVPRHRGRCRLAVFTTTGLYSDRGAGVARSPLPVA